jgi:Tfp pilus assembly protein PilX
MFIEKTLAGERGGVLVITMLLLVGLTALGAAFMTTSRSETQITGNVIRHSQALTLAEAGLNEAVARLSIPASPNYIAEDLTAANPGWGRYIVLQNGNSSLDPDCAVTATDGLDNDFDAATDEASERYPEVLSTQAGLDNPLLYPWVKVKYKLDSSNNIVLYGDHDNNRATPNRRNSVCGQPIITVTSRGEQAESNRTIEVDLIRPPAFDIQACLYTEDDDFQFGGNRFQVSGLDFDPATGDTVAGSTRKPAVVTTKDPDHLKSLLGPQELDQLIGAGGTADVQPATEDLNLEWYVDSWSRFSDLNYEGSMNAPSEEGIWGDYDNYKIIYIKDGDLTVKGTAYGGGLLLVDGDIAVTGVFEWHGVIIALGDVKLKGGGSGVLVYGGIFANGLGENFVVGQADLRYSSEAIARLKRLKGVLPLSWKEL